MTTRSFPGITAVAAAANDWVSGIRSGAVKNFNLNSLAAVMGYTPSATGAIERPIADALGDIVSVKAFGVKADGVTDDTTAMLRVRDSGIGMAVWPRGTIVCDELVWS
jgi:polygalacturonase